MSEKETVFGVHNNIVYATLYNDMGLKLNWVGTDWSLKDKINLLKELTDYRETDTVEYLLNKNVLKKLKEKVDKKFSSSYTDIMCQIVARYSLDGLTARFGQCYDHDTYEHWINYCIDKEISDRLRKYGRL